MFYGEQFHRLEEGSGTADGASNRDRSAGGSNDERGVKRAAEPSQALGAPRKKATPGPRVKSRICQVVGCDIEYSSTHECRARACQTHCAALSVRLKGQDPEQQFRFCYQCHKFHELDAFRNPDGTLRPRHNCYQSQALRLDRRKKKDAAAKAAKKNLDTAAVLEAQSAHVIDAVNLAAASNGNLILADIMEVAKVTQRTIANAQAAAAGPGTATAFAPGLSSFAGFSASSGGPVAGPVAGNDPSGPSVRRASINPNLTVIEADKPQQRTTTTTTHTTTTHTMGDRGLGVTTTLTALGGEAPRCYVERHVFEAHANRIDGGAQVQATAPFRDVSPSLGNPASGGDVASGARRASATIDETRFEELAHMSPEVGRDGGEFSPDLLHHLLSGTPAISK
mmetsp:Transcript_3817/g.14273  ORF Transcript_3817/g.14273 Transcript_3817/m.14273 type:complete len:396 (-) Transcript_3817:265-1452(-)